MSDRRYNVQENDSDFITNHWLIFVIGCATIYICRKYFNGLVLNKGIGISHAVSRRRRILRDPVSRRPPPLITQINHNDNSTSIHQRKVRIIIIYILWVLTDNKFGNMCLCTVATKNTTC